MKYQYYCGIYPDEKAVRLLEANKIKYETCQLTEVSYFTIYSDAEYCEELLKYIKTLSGTSISKSSIFSKKELEEANWYLLYVTRMGIDTRNVKYTYEAKCPYITPYGMQRHHHLEQINPYVSKKTPGWKKGYQFCSVETGYLTHIFCSDFAKDVIKNSGITGVEFMRVLKGDLETETPNVSQLVFKNKLPREAYTFIGDYHEQVCPFCGKINYIFKEQNCDNIRLNTNMIPNGIDAFGSQIIIGEGFGNEPIVISKKFYDLIFKELNEKPSHCIIYPIG